MKGVEFERGGGEVIHYEEELASMMTWTMTAPTTTHYTRVVCSTHACVLCILNNNNIMYILLASIIYNYNNS